MGMRGHKLVRDRDALKNLYALRRQGVILHITHRNKAVDPPQPQPVDHVRHELLKACILDTGHAFSTFEVGRGRIPAFLPLACIIDEELRHLAERAAFLAVVDDNAQSAGLGTARAFLNAVD